MNSSVIKASESTAARYRSIGDQASPVTLPAGKRVVCFVHIYQPDHNVDLLDILQYYFQIHFQRESWMSGIPAFHTPLPIWRYSWIWSQQAFCFENWVWSEYRTSINRLWKLKTLFFMRMSKNLLAIFSLNVYSVYGSQQRQKREVKKIFFELN